MKPYLSFRTFPSILGIFLYALGSFLSSTHAYSQSSAYPGFTYTITNSDGANVFDGFSTVDVSINVPSGISTVNFVFPNSFSPHINTTLSPVVYPSNVTIPPNNSIPIGQFRIVTFTNPGSTINFSLDFCTENQNQYSPNSSNLYFFCNGVFGQSQYPATVANNPSNPSLSNFTNNMMVATNYTQPFLNLNSLAIQTSTQGNTNDFYYREFELVVHTQAISAVNLQVLLASNNDQSSIEVSTGPNVWSQISTLPNIALAPSLYYTTSIDGSRIFKLRHKFKITCDPPSPNPSTEISATPNTPATWPNSCTNPDPSNSLSYTASILGNPQITFLGSTLTSLNTSSPSICDNDFYYQLNFRVDGAGTYGLMKIGVPIVSNYFSVVDGTQEFVASNSPIVPSVTWNPTIQPTSGSGNQTAFYFNQIPQNLWPIPFTCLNNSNCLPRLTDGLYLSIRVKVIPTIGFKATSCGAQMPRLTPADLNVADFDVVPACGNTNTLSIPLSPIYSDNGGANATLLNPPTDFVYPQYFGIPVQVTYAVSISNTSSFQLINSGSDVLLLNDLDCSGTPNFMGTFTVMNGSIALSQTIGSVTCFVGSTPNLQQVTPIPNTNRYTFTIPAGTTSIAVNFMGSPNCPFGTNQTSGNLSLVLEIDAYCSSCSISNPISRKLVCTSNLVNLHCQGNCDGVGGLSVGNNGSLKRKSYGYATQSDFPDNPIVDIEAHYNQAGPNHSSLTAAQRSEQLRRLYPYDLFEVNLQGIASLNNSIYAGTTSFCIELRNDVNAALPQEFYDLVDYKLTFQNQTQSSQNPVDVTLQNGAPFFTLNTVQIPSSPGYGAAVGRRLCWSVAGLSNNGINLLQNQYSVTFQGRFRVTANANSTSSPQYTLPGNYNINLRYQLLGVTNNSLTPTCDPYGLSMLLLIPEASRMQATERANNLNLLEIGGIVPNPNSISNSPCRYAYAVAWKETGGLGNAMDFDYELRPFTVWPNGVSAATIVGLDSLPPATPGAPATFTASSGCFKRSLNSPLLPIMNRRYQSRGLVFNMQLMPGSTNGGQNSGCVGTSVGFPYACNNNSSQTFNLIKYAYTPSNNWVPVPPPSTIQQPNSVNSDDLGYALQYGLNLQSPVTTGQSILVSGEPGTGYSFNLVLPRQYMGIPMILEIEGPNNNSVNLGSLSGLSPLNSSTQFVSRYLFNTNSGNSFQPGPGNGWCSYADLVMLPITISDCYSPSFDVTFRWYALCNNQNLELFQNYPNQYCCLSGLKTVSFQRGNGPLPTPIVTFVGTTNCQLQMQVTLTNPSNQTPITFNQLTLSIAAGLQFVSASAQSNSTNVNLTSVFNLTSSIAGAGPWVNADLSTGVINLPPSGSVTFTIVYRKVCSATISQMPIIASFTAKNACEAVLLNHIPLNIPTLPSSFQNSTCSSPDCDPVPITVQPACAGNGSITVSVQGQNTVYVTLLNSSNSIVYNSTISSTTPFSNLATGTYHITLFNQTNGHFYNSDVVVGALSPITANAGSDVTICQGASAQLSASGGNSNSNSYTFSWSPTTGLSNPNISNPLASPSATTTYTVTVTDPNNCSATDQVVVTVNNPASGYTLTAVPNNLVVGGSTYLLITGPGNELYSQTVSWSDNYSNTGQFTDGHSDPISHSNPGSFTYTVNIPGLNCPLSTEVSVSESDCPAPDVGFNAIMELCGNGPMPYSTVFSLNLLQNCAITNAQWDLGAGQGSFSSPIVQINNNTLSTSFTYIGPNPTAPLGFPAILTLTFSYNIPGAGTISCSYLVGVVLVIPPLTNTGVMQISPTPPASLNTCGNPTSYQSGPGTALSVVSIALQDQTILNTVSYIITDPNNPNLVIINWDLVPGSAFGATITFEVSPPYESSRCKHIEQVVLLPCCSVVSTINDLCNPILSPQTNNTSVPTYTSSITPGLSGAPVIIENTLFKLEGLVNINCDVTLRNCWILMGDGAGINVNPINHLRIEGCKIKSCQYLHNGIWSTGTGVMQDVNNPTIKITNWTSDNGSIINSLIQDANVALNVYGGASLVVENGTILSRNAIHVGLDGGGTAPYDADYPARIINSSLICYSPLLPQGPNGNAAPSRTKVGISVTRTKATIGDLTGDPNNFLTISHADRGIYVSAFGSIKANAFDISYCTYGIFCANRNLRGRIGIYNPYNIIGYPRATNPANTTPVNNISYCDSNGVYCIGDIRNTIQYTSFNNNARAGIFLDQNRVGCQVITRNQFEQNPRAIFLLNFGTFYGVSIHRNQINTYSNGYSDNVNNIGIAVNNMFYSGSNGLGSTAQLTIKNNIIQNCRKGIHLLGVWYAKMFSNLVYIPSYLPLQPTQAPPFPNVGLLVENCSKVSATSNNIFAPDDSNPCTYNCNGIRYAISSNNTVSCNQITDQCDALLFLGTTPTSYIGNNTMNNSFRGIVLGRANIGEQGSNFSPSDNRWMGTSFLNSGNTGTPHIFTFDMLGLPGNFGNKFYLRSPPGSLFQPYPFNNVYDVGSADQVNVPDLVPTQSPILPVNCLQVLMPNLLQLYEDVQAASAAGSTDPEALELLTKEGFYQYLKEEVGGVLPSSIQAFKDSMAQEVLGQIYDIKRDLAFPLDTAMLLQEQALTNALSPTIEMEDLYKQVMTIALSDNWLRKEVLTPAQIEQLRTIANLCPNEQGRAVYAARALLTYVDPPTTEYRHDCETVPTPNAQRQAAPPATASPLGKAKAAKPTGISLYPNPNTGSFTLTLSPGQSGLLEVATLEGRTVWQEWVKGNQTINPQPALSKGFYLCKISSSGKTLFVGKMVVQ